MRVVHISYSDKSGGAAIAAYRLHASLRQTDVQTIYYVLNKVSEDESVYSFQEPKALGAAIAMTWKRIWLGVNYFQYKRTRPGGYERFSQVNTKYGRAVVEQLPNCDLVNLHFVAMFVDLEEFFLFVNKPTVWTLHDMNAFTGGCHYDANCGKYVDACGACPQLGSESNHDLSRRVWANKKRVYDSVDSELLTIVTPSRWLQGLVENSPLLGRFPVRLVRYGIDLSLYSPRDASSLRNTLGINEKDVVLLFVSQFIKNRRKGFHLLLEALNELSICDRRVVLVSVGEKHEEFHAPLKHIALGKIESESRMAMVYSLADVFVVPSLQDNLPNTVIESIACGTPVVCFDVGGLSEMIKTGVNGITVDEPNARGLIQGIKAIATDDAMRNTLAQGARREAEKQYDATRQSAEYRRIYENMLIVREKIA